GQRPQGRRADGLHVLGGVLAPSGPVDLQVPQGAEDVARDVLGGATAVTDRAQHAGEGLLHQVLCLIAAHLPAGDPQSLGVIPVIQRSELADRPGAHRSHDGTVVTGFAGGPFGCDGHGSPGWVAGSGAVTDSPDCIVFHPVGEELTPTAVPGTPDTVNISGYGRDGANAPT